MSNELLKTRCDKGHVIVYDDKVTVGFDKLGFEKSETLARESIIGVDIKTTAPSIMGLGGGATVTIHSTGGKSIELRMVKPKDAKYMKNLLG
jgi:hypothetical protein